MEYRNAILCGMWAIWTARNKRTHGEKVMSISQTCTWERDMASDLTELSISVIKEEMQHKNVNWCPPLGSVKVNVDAAFSSEGQHGAMGLVIRDDQGQFIAASCKWYDDLPDVITAEAYACRDGVSLIYNINIPEVIIETDSQELVSLWKSRAVTRPCILPILNLIQVLSRNYVHFDICHVRREANMAAHLTAKFASPSKSNCIWMYQVPEFLMTCIQHDSHVE